MADGLSATVADSALDDIVGTNANDVQLHKGAPGSAGASNVSSVTTREAVTWAAASGGSVAASNEPEWTNWKPARWTAPPLKRAASYALDRLEIGPEQGTQPGT